MTQDMHHAFLVPDHPITLDLQVIVNHMLDHNNPLPDLWQKVQGS